MASSAVLKRASSSALLNCFLIVAMIMPCKIISINDEIVIAAILQRSIHALLTKPRENLETGRIPRTVAADENGKRDARITHRSETDAHQVAGVPRRCHTARSPFG